MPRLELIGGSYSARSVIANSQRCLNLYPEKNRPDAPTQKTHYQRPGFRPLYTPPVAGPCRGLYQASNGDGYTVIGTGFYKINSDFTLTQPTNVVTGQPAAVNTNITPVSMIDNGQTLILVDSSMESWQYIFASGNFRTIAPANDPGDIFNGATAVDVLDGFILWNVPGTREFGSTLDNTIVIDPTYLASKNGYPDPLIRLIVNNRQILLLGSLKGEIWFNSGGALFPFAEYPGTSLEHGCIAAFSVASQDKAVYWLSKDLQGQGMVLKQENYRTSRISNHALEYAIRQMQRAPNGLINDAIGYTYQQDGHVFYVLCFPQGNQTWAFDEAIGDPELAWSQRCWTNSDGTLNRDRSNCFAALYGKNVVGDWENGVLYELDPTYYVDTVGGTDYAITFLRTFPHLMMGKNEMGQPVLADDQEVMYTRFIADIECGNGPLDANGQPAKISLRWSDDRGKTYGQTVLQSSGAPGEWATSPKWSGTGKARDRVFELSHNIAGEAALNGAWIEGVVLPNVPG